MIEEQIKENASAAVPPPMLAMAAAAAHVAMLRMWLAGEVSCSSDALARQMMAANE